MCGIADFSGGKIKTKKPTLHTCNSHVLCCAVLSRGWGWVTQESWQTGLHDQLCVTRLVLGLQCLVHGLSLVSVSIC